MESKILAGLSFDPGILIIGMFILMLLMLIYIYTLHRKQNQLDKKYRAFMRGGRGAKSLDEALQNKMQSLNKITDVNDGLNDRITRLEKSMGRSYQKMGIVKYDAFKEMGGNLSFALCLLDDNNNGFILNTMHGRESSYTYIKEIENGTAYSTLGEEEKQALQKAISSDED